MAELNFMQGDSNKVFTAIAEATGEVTDKEPGKKKRKKATEYTKEERDKYMQSLKTSGRKGVKLPRINMAFTPENLEYIKCMGRVTGGGMTGFLNLIVHQHAAEHADIYERALQFQKEIDGALDT